MKTSKPTLLCTHGIAIVSKCCKIDGSIMPKISCLHLTTFPTFRMKVINAGLFFAMVRQNVKPHSTVPMAYVH